MVRSSKSGRYSRALHAIPPTPLHDGGSTGVDGTPSAKICEFSAECEINVYDC